MDNREGRHGRAQAWNRASTDGTEGTGMAYPTPAAPGSRTPLTPPRPIAPLSAPAQPAAPVGGSAPAPLGTPAQTGAYPAPAQPAASGGAYAPAPLSTPAQPWGYPAPAQPAAPGGYAPPPSSTSAQPAASVGGYAPAPVTYPAPFGMPAQAGAYPAPVQPAAPGGAFSPAPTPGTPAPYPTPAYAPAPGSVPATRRRVWTQTVGEPLPEYTADPSAAASGLAPAPVYIPKPMPAQVVARRDTPAQPDARRAEPPAGAVTETARRRRTNPYEYGQAAPEGTAGDAMRSAEAAAAGTPFTGAPDGDAPQGNHLFGDGKPAPWGAQENWAAPQPSATAEEPEWTDDDSGRYDAVRHAPMADPVPVPTQGAYLEGLTRVRHRRHPLRAVLILLLALATVGCAVYFTGVGDEFFRPLLRTVGISLPARATAAPAALTTAVPDIVPAKKAEAPALRSATVEPATAKAPANLVFSLETNAVTSAILLLTEDNATLHTSAYGSPKGDGLLWNVTADFSEPYTGKVRIFLRDQAGTWSEGALTCAVEVQ